MTHPLFRIPRALMGVLVAAVILRAAPLQAQQTFDPKDGPSDLTIKGFEAAKEKAVVVATREMNAQFKDDVQFLDDIQQIPKLREQITVYQVPQRRTVTGILYEVDLARGLIRVQDTTCLIADLSPADQIRIGYMKKKPDEIKLDIEKRRHEVENTLKTKIDIRRDQILARTYSEAFFKHTVVMNGVFRYQQHMGTPWYPIPLRTLDVRATAREARAAAEDANLPYIPFDPQNAYVDIIIERNMLKMPGQMVVLVNDKAVETSYHAVDGQDVKLDGTPWAFMRVTVRKADLGMKPDKDGYYEDRIGGKQFDHLRFMVYSPGVGHWTYSVSMLGVRPGPDDLLYLRLVLPFEPSPNLGDRKVRMASDFSFLVDAQGREEAENADFAKMVADAAAYQAALETERQAAVKVYESKLQDTIIKIDIDMQRLRDKENLARVENDVRTTVKERQAEHWFSPARLPPATQDLMKDASVSYPDEIKVIGSTTLPSFLNGEPVNYVSEWIELEGAAERVSGSHRVVGTWYRFVNTEPLIDGQRVDVYYVQTATYYQNLTDTMQTLSPRATIGFREIGEQVPDKTYIDTVDGDLDVYIRHTYNVLPSASVWLVGLERVSFTQVYRRVNAAACVFERNPPTAPEPASTPTAPATTSGATDPAAPATGTDATDGENRDGKGEAAVVDPTDGGAG